MRANSPRLELARRLVWVPGEPAAGGWRPFSGSEHIHLPEGLLARSLARSLVAARSQLGAGATAAD